MSGLAGYVTVYKNIENYATLVTCLILNITYFVTVV
jgi:hypothetical protein